MAANQPVILAPSGKLQRFWDDSITYDIALALCALTTAVLGAAEKQSDFKWIYVAIALTVCLLAVAKVIKTWKYKEAIGSPDRLKSSLYALQTILLNYEPIESVSEPRLRVTVHVPTQSKTELEQVLEYIGDDRGNKTAHRRFPVHCGIIGHSYRTKEPVVAVRESSTTDEYVNELVQEWGYTREEAAKRDTSVYTWLAIPLTSEDGQDVFGIVYMDSNHPDFFTEGRFELALLACVGIANFVGKEYS